MERLSIGKLPERLLKELVLSGIGKRRPEVLLGAAVGEDCAALMLEEGEAFVLSTDPITACEKEIGSLAIQVTLNDLATTGCEPLGVLLTVLLPPGTGSMELGKLMEDAERTCAENQVEILGGHTEVSDAVNRILVNVCGVGKVKREELIRGTEIRGQKDLVATKWIGLEGTVLMAREKGTELEERFSKEAVSEALHLSRFLSVLPEARIAAKNGALAMHDVTEGGILGALWELAEAGNCGITAELSAIPLREDTRKFCDCFGLDPYRLISSGCMLIAVPDGRALTENLRAAHIPAALIGKTTDTKERLLIVNGKPVPLEPPAADEIYKIV